MEANRTPQATLNDLIDRIFDKGILLNTDLIICVAGIPLLGLNLKLALAGMETMLEYGIMADWDEAQRAVAKKEAETGTKGLPLGDDEYVIFSTFGTVWYSGGIYNTWRPGNIYITNKRLIVFRKIPPEVLFEKYYEEIRAASIKEKDHFTGEKRYELYLLLEEDKVARMHTTDSAALKNAMEDVMKKKGLCLEENTEFADKKDVLGDFLKPGEDVTHSEKMWYQMPFMMDGTLHYQWKSGHLYLTNNRFCWWYDFDQKLLFDIPSHQIVYASIEKVPFGNVQVQEKSLVVQYKEKEEEEIKIACFSGSEKFLVEWEHVIGAAIREREQKKHMETCPKCGKDSFKNDLLENGCSRCGWVSHRKRY